MLTLMTGMLTIFGTQVINTVESIKDEQVLMLKLVISSNLYSHMKMGVQKEKVLMNICYHIFRQGH